MSADNSYPLLRVESGPQAGREATLNERLVIGRGEECDVRLVEEKVSRRHAILENKSGRHVLRDLGSSNGTMVNGRIVVEAELNDGDRLHIGSTEIVFLARPENEKKTQIITKAAKPVHSQVESVLLAKDADLLTGAVNSEQISLAFRLVRHLPGNLDSKKLIRTWLTDLLKEFGADSGALLTIDDGREQLVVWPEAAAAPKLSRTVVDRILSGGEALLVTDLEDKDVAGSKSLAGAQVATLIAAPIPVSDGQAIVYLDRKGVKEPFTQKDLAVLVEAARVMASALDAARQHSQHIARLQQLTSGPGKTQLVGKAPAFVEALGVALRAAPYTTSVLIGGPTGSGKELVARLIHDESPRAARPFVAVNCAALPEGLQESGLFGHERGAFTGATQSKEGYFKLADGGTLFLDEVGDLAPAAQVKVLRAVEAGEFYAVGSTKLARVDVRVVAATNRDLPADIAAGKFREDLYHRLNVVKLDLPALKNRPGDIRLLAAHFLERKAVELKRPIRTISERALAALEKYAWPGNVRELCNLIERAIVLSAGAQLDLADFPRDVVSPSNASSSSIPPATEAPITLEEAERRAIIHALTFTNWQKTKAAEILGTSWPTLQKKIHDYGLKPPPGK